MKVRGIEWDRVNRSHFREQGRCTESQVEDVIRGRCHRTRIKVEPRDPGTEPRWRLQGRTYSGRFLCVIATPRPGASLRPITCWPLSDKHRESYLAWTRSLPR